MPEGEPSPVPDTVGEILGMRDVEVTLRTAGPVKVEGVNMIAVDDNQTLWLLDAKREPVCFFNGNEWTMGRVL